MHHPPDESLMLESPMRYIDQCEQYGKYQLEFRDEKEMQEDLHFHLLQGVGFPLCGIEYKIEHGSTPLWIDLLAIKPGDCYWIIECKQDVRPSAVFHKGIGQLMNYRFLMADDRLDWFRADISVPFGIALAVERILPEQALLCQHLGIELILWGHMGKAINRAIDFHQNPDYSTVAAVHHWHDSGLDNGSSQREIATAKVDKHFFGLSNPQEHSE